MNQLWINKDINRTCILFFNGWGMDKNAIAHLSFEGSDLCMFNDYRTIGPILEKFTEYQNIVLVAWSLGVWGAEQAMLLSKIPVNKSIAINGTPLPVHDEYGIPENVFVKTIQGWNEINRNKFNRRMMGSKSALTEFEQFLPDRSIIQQKSELISIFEMQKNNRYQSGRFCWDVVIIGLNDLIFPVANQQNWWIGKSKIIEIDQPHFPFKGFECWDQIIRF